MKFKIGNKQYVLSLTKRIIPTALCRNISSLAGSNEDIYTKSNSPKLIGKVALVTGGYRGIGLAISRILLREGANVIITGRNGNKLDEICQRYGGGHLKYLVWDISEFSLCKEKFEEASKLFGKIDILVNNAGVTTDGKDRVIFESMTSEHFKYVHDINTIGTRQMCVEYAGIVDNGTILNIISNTSIRAAQDAYFTSKWAIYSFTKAFGNECQHSGKNIKINGLCPGPIKTPMSFVEGGQLFRPEIPNHRIGLPEEIGEMALTIILSSLDGLNGKIYVNDGGETLF